MAKIDYQSILDTIVTTLQAGMGADLDTGLTVAVKQVIKGDPNLIPVQVNMYPTIFVYLTRKSETWDALGGQLKKATIYFDVYALVYLQGTSDTSDAECRKLASNIEGLLRTNFNLTSKVDFCNPSECSFERAYKEGVYLSAAVITLECEKTVI